MNSDLTVPKEKKCVADGCSGELCGECGWTQTQKIVECLKGK